MDYKKIYFKKKNLFFYKIKKKKKKTEEIVFPEILIKYDHIQPSQDQDITNKLWPSPYQFNGSLSKEAYCKECDQWIKLTTDTDASSVKKIYKNWWKHSRLCNNFYLNI